MKKVKKVWVIGLVAALGLGLIGTCVYAGGGMGYGYGPRGYGYGAWTGKPVDSAAFQAFQKETLPWRDEMATKRVELRNEYWKEKPDQNRIATLQKEMVDLRSKIKMVAEKQGLPTAGYGPGMAGRGHGRMAGGPGWGDQGFGGRGYGRGYCPMW